MKRKIIQLVAVPESEKRNACLYALCDDGTLWYRILSSSSITEWGRVKEEIPQDDNKEESVKITNIGQMPWQ